MSVLTRRPVVERDPGTASWLRGLLYQSRIFVKRGFVHNSSYRLNFSLSVVNVLIGLISYYFLSRAVNKGVLGPYGDNPAGFIIVGTTFTTFISVALASYAGSIRSEMFLGTIEHWLLSASSMTRLVILSTIWEFLWPLITTMITFVLLVTIIGGGNVHFDINVPAMIVFFLLAVIVMSGFGLISAGIIMVSKIGDPLATGWGAINSLFIGALFPIVVLPLWMQHVSDVLPNFHALNGLRASMLQGASLSSQTHELVILLISAAVVVPLGVLGFWSGFERARSQGTLAQF